jgi:hypothetical protein
MHYQGHLRDTFLRAFEVFVETNGDPEAQVTHEVRYEETAITLRKAAGMMRTCTDQIPGTEYEQLKDALGRAFRPTYAGAGFAMIRHWNQRAH